MKFYRFYIHPSYKQIFYEEKKFNDIFFCYNDMFWNDNIHI